MTFRQEALWLSNQKVQGETRTHCGWLAPTTTQLIDVTQQLPSKDHKQIDYLCPFKTNTTSLNVSVSLSPSFKFTGDGLIKINYIMDLKWFIWSRWSFSFLRPLTLSTHSSHCEITGSTPLVPAPFMDRSPREHLCRCSLWVGGTCPPLPHHSERYQHRHLSDDPPELAFSTLLPSNAQ